MFRVQEQLTRIRPEDVNASTAVDLQGKAQQVIKTIDARTKELKAVEKKVDEVIMPKPIVDTTNTDTSTSPTGGGSSANSAVDIARQQLMLHSLPNSLNVTVNCVKLTMIWLKHCFVMSTSGRT